MAHRSRAQTRSWDHSVSARPPQSQRLTLALLWCGMVGPILFTLSYGINEALRSHFNPWQESISMLTRGPDGWVQRASFILFGLMSLGFAGGLARVHPPPGGSPWLARCQAAIGLGLVLAGLLVQQRLEVGRGGVLPAGFLTPYGYITLPGFAHVLAAVLIYLATTASCLLVGRRLRHRPGWQAGARYSSASGWLYLLMILGFAVSPLVGGPAGLFERVAGLVAALWTIWFARRITRAVAREGAIGSDGRVPST